MNVPNQIQDYSADKERFEKVIGEIANSGIVTLLNELQNRPTKKHWTKSSTIKGNIFLIILFGVLIFLPYTSQMLEPIEMQNPGLVALIMSGVVIVYNIYKRTTTDSGVVIFWEELQHGKIDFLESVDKIGMIINKIVADHEKAIESKNTESDSP